MNSTVAQAQSEQNQTADSSAQLLDQLQQRINSVKEQLSPQYLERFSNALNHAKKVHDFFRNGKSPEAEMSHAVKIIESQLEDMLEVASVQQSIDDAKSDFGIELTTNEFSPRAKIGQRLAMRRGCLAEDGDLVAIKLDDKWRVEW